MVRNGRKSPLVLMEQVIMVLVFALAAALCIQAFVIAGNISRQMKEKERAWGLGQTLAETVKACGGDLAAVQQRLGGEVSDTSLVFYYDRDWKETEVETAAYQVSFSDTGYQGYLRTGEIAVTATGDDRQILSIDVAWQGDRADG